MEIKTMITATWKQARAKEEKIIFFAKDFDTNNMSESIYTLTELLIRYGVKGSEKEFLEKNENGDFVFAAKMARFDLQKEGEELDTVLCDVTMSCEKICEELVEKDGEQHIKRDKMVPLEFEKDDTVVEFKDVMKEFKDVMKAL